MICNCTQVVNESSVMLRLDQHFSTRTTGFMRFNYDRSVNTQPLSASATDLQQKVSAPVNGVLELLHIFNSRLVNEAHAGFNRVHPTTSTTTATPGSFTRLQSRMDRGLGFVTENYDYTSIYVGNSFSANRQPDLESRPAYDQGRRGVPPRSNESGSPGRRNHYVFLGGESGGECGEKSQP